MQIICREVILFQCLETLVRFFTFGEAHIQVDVYVINLKFGISKILPLIEFQVL